MRELVGRPDYLGDRPHLAQYPLQGRMLIWGLVAAVIGGSLFKSPLAGFAFLVLFGAIGALWRRDETPILAFCIAYQWLFIVTGYLYQRITGHYPGLNAVGDLQGAVLLSLIGLLVLAAGIRTGIRLIGRHMFGTASEFQAEPPSYDIQRLFWYVILLHTIYWFRRITPEQIWFNAAQIIYNILAFAAVLLFLLFLIILQQQKGYGFGVVALLFVLIPSWTSTLSSGYSLVFYLLFLALLSIWRPWSPLAHDQQRNRHVAWAAAAIVIFLLVIGLLWQGGVKAAWRQEVATGSVASSAIERSKALLPILSTVASELDWGQAVESVAERVSSGVGYFSLALRRVPALIPHEEGYLTWRAVKHSFMPRILFPDKPNLGGDSWLVWTYAGVAVAGDEQGTSVGLGYMAEFYIDFGVPGMFIPLFFYGVIIGLVYGAIYTFTPSVSFARSVAVIVFWLHLVSYEGEIAKLLGGMLQTALVLILIMQLIGFWLHQRLIITDEATWRTGDWRRRPLGLDRQLSVDE